MKPYWRVTLAYALFGILWIFLSDRLVDGLIPDSESRTVFQTMKGWLFVALSSALVWVITRRAFESEVRREREKLAVFRKTAEGSYHILLNYLNQMQLVTMEAEQCRGFDPEVLRLARGVSDEAAAELAKLCQLETITPEHIDAVVFEKLRGRSSEPK